MKSYSLYLYSSFCVGLTSLSILPSAAPGKPGVLQSMGSQRAGHDWETEQRHYPLGPSTLLKMGRFYSKSPTYEPLVKFPTFKDVNVRSHIQSRKFTGLVHTVTCLYPLQVVLLLCNLQCACWVASVVSNSLQPCRLAHWAPLYGILQARILEWVAIPFSRGSSWTRDWTQVS